MLANFNCQITMTRHLGAKRLTQERGAIGALPPNNHLGSYNYICTVIGIRNWLSYIGCTFYIKNIALSASVG